MKKTFLLIAALIIGATSANAQRFISADALTVQKKAVKTEASINPNIKKQAKSLTKDAFVYGTPVLTVSFDDATQYEFLNLSGHTAGTNQAKFRRLDTSSASTTILQSTYPNFYYYFAMSSRGYYWIKNLLGEEDQVGDGYAFVSPYDIYVADGESSTKIYNTAIKFTEGFSTIGFKTVDVVFNQYTMRFNNDRYFIDYTTDPSWNVYDSIEFNVKDLELGSNEEASGEKRVTLPVASSVEKANLYIRLRYYSPLPTGNNVSQPSGYRWLVDEIKVYNGPEYRIDVLNTYHYNAAYGIIPEGMQMDTIGFSVRVDNTGGNTLFGALADERFHNATGVFPNAFGALLSTENVSPTPYDLTTNTWIDTTTTSGVITSLDIRRYKTLEARNVARMYNDTPGFYGISTGVKYLQSSTGTDYSLSPMDDSIYYQVSAMPTVSDSIGTARWASDVDVLIEGRAFAYGFDDGFISEVAPGSKVAGYEVCNRFITPNDLDSNTYYAKGVEVVPAADSCETGKRIQASLKYMDWSEDNADNYIKPVVAADGTTAVVSDKHTTSTEDLNNDLFTAPGLQYSTTYNSIYMPFVQGNIVLQPGQWYYACYKLIDDARFLVAREDKDLLPTFKTFDWYSKLVLTPGQESEGHPWGYAFGEWLSKYNAPMIRLMVSKNGYAAPSSLNDITTPSFNLNAYPNPAKNEATIEYTLNTNGNVVITLTDIMGRNVLTMNNGNQASNTTYRVALNTNTLNNGTYFYTLNVNGTKETKKLVINK